MLFGNQRARKGELSSPARFVSYVPMKRAAPAIVAFLFSASALFAELPTSFADNIAAIQAIGSEGAGNKEATTAWQAIAKADGEAILPLLQAMEAASPVSKNMLRSAVEVISENELAAGKKLPVDSLGTFVLNTSGSPQARRFAFDLLSQVDSAGARKLVPGFINDPAVSFRREAVTGVMIAGKAQLEKDKDAAAKLYREALNAARDVDQIDEITKTLRELGQEVNLPKHFGFLMDWKLIGPFDNSERAGYDTVFPPENEIKLDATYDGKGTAKVKWVAFTSADEYGMIDFNKPFTSMKEVVGYAHTEFEAAEAGPAELRLGCKNAWKIWFNGELIFARDEYHRGARIDQYILPIRLSKGTNTILVKACQNETDESWTVQWEFQLRICDSTGTAILATNRKKAVVAPPAKKK